jgi:hypothetical protein
MKQTIIIYKNVITTLCLHFARELWYLKTVHYLHVSFFVGVRQLMLLWAPHNIVDGVLHYYSVVKCWFKLLRKQRPQKSNDLIKVAQYNGDGCKACQLTSLVFGDRCSTRTKIIISIKIIKSVLPQMCTWT